MAFRGYLMLNGGELANSSRVIGHLRGIMPTLDAGFWGTPDPNACALVPVLPNRIRDAGMHDAGIWPRSGSSLSTYDATMGHGRAKSVRLEGGGGTPAILYSHSGGTDAVTVTPNAPLRMGSWFYGSPDTPAGTISVALQFRFDDTTGTNPTSYLTVPIGSSALPRGQWLYRSGEVQVPAGMDRARGRLVINSSSVAGSVVWVSEPVVNLLTDAPEPGMYELPPGTPELRELAFAPPTGYRMYDRAAFEVDGTCWEPKNFCTVEECLQLVGYDDSWPGLQEWTADSVEYRVELAPWYSTRIPESGEFAGMLIMDIKGLGATPVERSMAQAVGHGGIPGAHRDKPRELEFDALLIACTNAGLEYGLEWLTCQLRGTKDRVDSTLQFFNAHPSHTAAEPESLLRETHGVIYTGEPTISEQFAPSGKNHQQATIYRVTWRMGVASPYVYLPSVTTDVVWDKIQPKKVNWLHQADCEQPYTCLDMPVMFSATCVPEEIEVVSTPPPSCGGCMPVCTMLQHSWTLPGRDLAHRCRETAVSLEIVNNGASQLTLQAFWRICGSDVRCENSKWPLQVAGLPAGTSLTLDSVSGRYWTNYDGRRWLPRGIVSTPTGAPWMPTVLDRSECWELIVVAPDQVDFDIIVTMADREP